MNDPARTGAPVLVGPDGTRVLERVPLMPEGKGAFDEAWLQRLIHDNPACLPIAEIEPGLDTFAAVCREMPTPRGPVDNLLMTGAGDVAIVEAKLFRNPEARRQAVAQALDYATALFGMGYEAFEKAVLAGTFDGPKPASLHAALPEAGKLNESTFVDAVASNLRRGRALILVVGDGIRAEAEALLAGLQVHARHGFTLALIELGVFRMPGEVNRFLVRPRTLAKTEIVQRTIVEVTNGKVAAIRDEPLAVPGTLGVETYWQALEAKVPGARAALEELIRAAKPLGVYPEVLGSLNLKWQQPGDRSVNLGYIQKNTSLWTDLATGSAPRDLAHVYVKECAAAFDCDVHTMPTSGNWTLYKDSRPLRLAKVLGKLHTWLEAMQHFIAAIQRYDATAGDSDVGCVPPNMSGMADGLLARAPSLETGGLIPTRLGEDVDLFSLTVMAKRVTASHACVRGRTTRSHPSHPRLRRATAVRPEVVDARTKSGHDGGVGGIGHDPIPLA